MRTYATALLAPRQLPSRTSRPGPWSADRRAGTILVPWASVRDRLPKGAWGIWRYLRGLANNHLAGWVHARRAVIAKALRVSVSTVARACFALTRAGLLRNLQTPGGCATRRQVLGRYNDAPGADPRFGLVPEATAEWIACTTPVQWGGARRTEDDVAAVEKAVEAKASIEDVQAMVGAPAQPTSDPSATEVKEPKSPKGVSPKHREENQDDTQVSSKMTRTLKSRKEERRPTTFDLSKRRDSCRQQQSLASLPKKEDKAGIQTELESRFRQPYAPDVRTREEAIYPIQHFARKSDPELGIEKYEPPGFDFVGAVHSCRMVPYPSPSVFPEGLDLKAMVEVMLKAYREAVRHHYRERCFSHCQGDIERNTVYSALSNAAELLDAHGISPVTWAINAVRYWKTEKRRKKWPPIQWVFSPARIDACPSFGVFTGDRTHYFVPAWSKLFAMQNQLNDACRRTRSHTEYVAAVKALGITLADIKKLQDRCAWEFNVIETRLAEYAAQGRWIWA